MGRIRAILEIKVIPRAKRPAVSLVGEQLRISITEPPAENKANTAVIDLLSKQLKINKSALKIISGKASRMKLVEIEGVTHRQVMEKLAHFPDESY